MANNANPEVYETCPNCGNDYKPIRAKCPSCDMAADPDDDDSDDEEA